MNVGQIFELFKQYCDEPDTTFLTDANAATYLGMGYNEFRSTVQQVSPEAYSTSVVITVNGNNYDLSSISGNPVSLLGPAPTVTTTTSAAAAGQPIIVVASVTGLYLGQSITVNPTGHAAQATTIAGINATTKAVTLAANLTNPMTAGDTAVVPVAPLVSLNNVRYSNSAGTNRGRIFRMVSNLRTLETDYESVSLINTVLTFSITISGTVLVTYVPDPALTWASGSTAFIDNFGMFHDLIALYAYKQYAIRDAAVNPIIFEQIKNREQKLQAHILSMRQEGTQYVNRTEASYDYI